AAHVIVLDAPHLQRQSAEIDVAAAGVEIDLSADGGRYPQRDVARAGLDAQRCERGHERDVDVAAAGVERHVVTGRAGDLDIARAGLHGERRGLPVADRHVSRPGRQLQAGTLHAGDRDVARARLELYVAGRRAQVDI